MASKEATINIKIKNLEDAIEKAKQQIIDSLSNVQIREGGVRMAKAINSTLSAKRIVILETERHKITDEILALSYPREEELISAYVNLEKAFKEAIHAESKYLASLE